MSKFPVPDEKPQSQDVDTPLFRREVLAERDTQTLGTVLLAPSVPLRVFALFAAGATIAVLALLVFGEYTRTAQVSGWLVPQQGLIRAFAPQPGVVTHVYIAEGAKVDAGKPLLEVSTDVQSVASGGTQAEIARQLAVRRASLVDDLARQDKLSADHGADLTARIASLQLERGSLQREASLQRERLSLMQGYAAKRKMLLARGLTTGQSVQAAEENRLAQAADLAELERKAAACERDLATLQAELRDLPLTKQTKIADIQRQIAALDQDAAMTDARRRLIVPAPQSGTVATLQADVGDRVDGSAPLLTIIPSGAKLEAQLFTTSRAIGFIRQGQKVRLRYQAFPYQKFGQYDGVVTRVSRSAISPADLAPKLAGLIDGKEPVYRITVELKSQTVRTYGANLPLQPGMQLDASIAMERRTLIEWMFEPLFTLTGGLQ